MLTAAPASRLLCAITFTVVMTPALADLDWEEDPEYAWKTYLADCEHLQRAVTDVQDGRKTAKDVLPTIESRLRTITVHRKNLAQPSFGSPDYARCESVISQVKDVAAKGTAEYNEELDQYFRQAQTDHLNSPEYKRARSLGFSDVGDIGDISDIEDIDDIDKHAELAGEANLKTLMIKVDSGCGRYLRAVQYVKPYVIYTAHRSDGNCAANKRVAVLGGRTVERGDEIDEDGIFRYVGWKKLHGADGFPIDIRVVKALE